MDKICVVCNKVGNYKCPTCLVYYCSVSCCNIHRANECDVVLKHSTEVLVASQQSQLRYTTQDTVPIDKLLILNSNEDLKNLLSNPHLRQLLAQIDASDEPEKIMQLAMQEPLFVEFADVCLKVVEPPHTD